MVEFFLRRRLAGVLALLSLLITGFSSPAFAHPHYWVSVKLDVELDAQGRVVAIQQEWHFDDFVSAILLDEMESVVPGRPPLSVLASESKRIVNDLEPFNYYSHFSSGTKSFEVPAPKSYFLRVMESGQGPVNQPKPSTNLLVLTMRFEWAKPLELSGEGLTVSVYDPTYYASFNHQSVEQVTVSAPSNLNCETAVNLPNPDDAMIAYAFSLDQTQRDTQGLGQHFAEVVTIGCQQQGAH